MKVYYLTLGKAISHGNLINTLTFPPVITSDVYCLICCNKRSVISRLLGLHLTDHEEGMLPLWKKAQMRLEFQVAVEISAFQRTATHQAAEVEQKS